MATMTAGVGPHSTFQVGKDGPTLAYEILGSSHLGHRKPIVLVGGATSLRGDWDRLVKSLANERPVLLYDHRGMGDSTLSLQEGEVMTIEMLARDLLALLTHLHWPELSICGFSMGGKPLTVLINRTIAQQLLFLPYHASNPTTLPFRVTHVFLTGTLPYRSPDVPLTLKLAPTGPGRRRTIEEKREVARVTLEGTFDPRWIANPANSERLNWWLDRMVFGRPMNTILMQTKALHRWNPVRLHEKMPKDIRILVIHGELDEVVPFSYGQKILELLPSAKMVEVGTQPGQVENLAFGHHWFEYFDIRVWCDVFEKFLGESEPKPTVAKL